MRGARYGSVGAWVRQTGRLVLFSLEPEGVADIIGGYPGFLPGVVVALIVAAVVAKPLSRALRVRRMVGGTLAIAIGVVLAATLTAGPEAPDFSSKGAEFCDLSRPELPPIASLAINDRHLNVFLFIPLGTALGLVPRSRRKVVLVGAAILAPFAIETIQGVLAILDRACQSRDVVDNLIGLLTGLFAGSLIGRLLPTLARGHRGTTDPEPM